VAPCWQQALPELWNKDKKKKKQRQGSQGLAGSEEF